MATTSSRLRRSYTPLSVDNYQFTVGGEADYIEIDVVDDPHRGLGVPGKSMFIENHGGGSGINRLYFQTSEDGYRWSEVMSIRGGANEGYSADDGIRIWLIKIWASNANLSFSMRVTPGIWSEDELIEIGRFQPEILPSSPSPDPTPSIQQPAAAAAAQDEADLS